MAELADAIDLGSITARCGGSSPLVGTGFSQGCDQARARGLAGRRLLCKEKIVGSNPTGSTLAAADCGYAVFICGRSSVVERLLAKEKVVSSNLIARSRGRPSGRPF